MPPTTTIDIAAAKRLLLTDMDVSAVADRLGVSANWLGRYFAREVGQTPAAWRRAHLGARDRASRPVFFRYPRFAELTDLAEADGVEPNAWARAALDAAVDAAHNRAKKKR